MSTITIETRWHFNHLPVGTVYTVDGCRYILDAEGWYEAGNSSYFPDRRAIPLDGEADLTHAKDMSEAQYRRRLGLMLLEAGRKNGVAIGPIEKVLDEAGLLSSDAATPQPGDVIPTRQWGRAVPQGVWLTQGVPGQEEYRVLSRDWKGARQQRGLSVEVHGVTDAAGPLDGSVRRSLHATITRLGSMAKVDQNWCSAYEDTLNALGISEAEALFDKPWVRRPDDNRLYFVINDEFPGQITVQWKNDRGEVASWSAGPSEGATRDLRSVGGSYYYAPEATRNGYRLEPEALTSSLPAESRTAAGHVFRDGCWREGSGNRVPAAVMAREVNSIAGSGLQMPVSGDTLWLSRGQVTVNDRHGERALGTTYRTFRSIDRVFLGEQPDRLELTDEETVGLQPGFALAASDHYRFWPNPNGGWGISRRHAEMSKLSFVEDQTNLRVTDLKAGMAPDGALVVADDGQVWFQSHQAWINGEGNDNATAVSGVVRKWEPSIWIQPGETVPDGFRTGLLPTGTAVMVDGDRLTKRGDVWHRESSDAHEIGAPDIVGGVVIECPREVTQWIKGGSVASAGITERSILLGGNLRQCIDSEGQPIHAGSYYSTSLSMPSEEWGIVISSEALR